MDTPITDIQLLEIAYNVPSADYHGLGIKLGQGLKRLEEILDSKNNNHLRSTVDILISWRAAEPGESWGTKRSRLKTILSSLGIKTTDALLPAVEQQEQEQEAYQGQLGQQRQNPAESISQDNLSSMNNSEVDSAVSSLRSVDSRTISSLRRNEDASRTIESTQGSVPLYQASNSATSGFFHREPKFFDIYLQYSQDTVHVHKVKDIIRRNGWTMMTANDNRLGVSKILNIEDALKICSHVVLIIIKEDCEKDDPYQTMTMGMAFQSMVGRSLNGRVISIRCCEESHLPLSLQSLENACINDPYLEDKLKRTIDVSIRKNKEGSLVDPRDEPLHDRKENPLKKDTNSEDNGQKAKEPSQGASSSRQPQQTYQSTEETLENISGRQEDFDEQLTTVARKVARRDEIDNLGKALGFEPEDIQRYVDTNMKNSVSYMGTLSMLRDWRKRQLKAKECEALKDVLKKAGQIRLANILFDDTDKNEGNNDQLTSFKHDSGSNWDDVSFGGLSAPPEILARGRRARRAYAEAAKAGKKKVFRTRLMLVGQERVGKTSLKKTLTGQGFDKNEAITDGVETTNTCDICIEVAKAGEKMWSIHKKGHENEDEKEDEYQKALADEIAKRLIVNPLQEQESLEPYSDTTLDRGLNPGEPEEFVKAQEEDYNIPNQLESLVEKRLKEQVHLKEIGTDSADSGRGEGASLSIWDFAGHDVYYSTHQVFLTWRAIYMIVFDLSRSLDSVVPPESRDKYYEKATEGAKSELTCLEFINFWLYSIYAHAVAPSSVINKNSSKTALKSPLIFIVGTHRESVRGDAHEKKEKIRSAFEKIRESIMKRPFECHVVPKYYAIENSLEDEDEELVALRTHIGKVAMEEPYMGEEIPLRWLLFEEALAADKINYMSLDQTKELMQPFRMESEHELLTMLTFYHDLGYVVYYGGIEDQHSLLRDMVILNPQWLIDVFKQVITILDPAERDGIVRDAWTTLEEDGILEDRLIQYMWEGFLEKKEALVKLMEKFDLICEAPVERLQPEQQDGVDTEVSIDAEKVVQKRYYVPSRLTSPCPPEEIGQIKSSTDFYVDFRGFLPDGMFHRLMSRAARWMRERDGEPVNLFYRHISLMVDGVHHALIEMLPLREATIKVTVFHGAVAGSDDDWGSNKPPAPSAVKEVMDFVTETLDSLIQHWTRRIKYDVCFLCPSPKCNSKKRLKDCYRGMSLKCGLHSIPTAAIKFKYGMSEEGVESGNRGPVMPKRSTCNESNVLCDLHFSHLAEQIGSEWHQLGIRLGLNQSAIDHITEDKLTAVDRRVAMLQLWRNRSSCSDKRKMVEELCEALSSCDRTDLESNVKETAGIN